MGLVHARGVHTHLKVAQAPRENVAGAFDDEAFAVNAFNVGVLTWLPASGPDDKLTNKYQARNRRCYRSDVVNRPVQDTLVEARDFLRSLRRA